MFFLQSCVYSLNCMIKYREKHSNEFLRKVFSIMLIPAGIVKYLYKSLCSWIGIFKPENRCAVVLIIKNEGRYIKEFVDYYSSLGCDVIIYDNDSDDGFQKQLSNDKNVTIVPWHGKKRQTDAYNHACNTLKHKYKYLCFFDADEFLVDNKMLSGNLELFSIIDSYFSNNKIAGLGINWLIFGSSGLEEYPKGGVIDNFTKCANDNFEWNQLVKSCVRPCNIAGWVNPHVPLPVGGKYMINTDHVKITSPRNELPCHLDLRLYHYFVKNKKHFEEKVNKGKADRSDKRDMSEFYYYDKNEVENTNAISVKQFMIEKGNMNAN